MSSTTKIEWTDATWNPITGCSVLSAGCTNCYAMRLAGGRLRHHPSRAGLTRESGGRHVWTGEVRFNEQWLDEPLRWRRPRRVFVCAHGDLFHENVPDEWIDSVFSMMSLAPEHTFQVLTKRAKRAKDYLSRFSSADDATGLRTGWVTRDGERATARVGPIFPEKSWPLPNVWLGVSVEDQATADERIPILLDTPATLRWVSAEPLLGMVDLNGMSRTVGAAADEVSADDDALGPPLGGVAGIDWVVAGGESGPAARPSHPEWVRSLRDQCAKAGVPFLFKQWGEWAPPRTVHRLPRGFKTHQFYDDTVLWKYGKKIAGRTLDGTVHDESPGVTI